MTRPSQFAIGVVVCLTLAACQRHLAHEGDEATETTTGAAIDSEGVAPFDETFEPGPGGIRRLLRAQYIGSIGHLLGDEAAAAAAPAADYPLHGFDAIGAAVL